MRFKVVWASLTLTPNLLAALRLLSKESSSTVLRFPAHDTVIDQSSYFHLSFPWVTIL